MNAAKGSYEEAARQSKISSETLNQTARVYYYQLLNDFNEQIESLQASQLRNNDHRLFATKYLNIFDRIIYLSDNGLIGSYDVAKYFVDDIKAARGLLEMNE